MGRGYLNASAEVEKVVVGGGRAIFVGVRGGSEVGYGGG